MNRKIKSTLIFLILIIIYVISSQFFILNSGYYSDDLVMSLCKTKSIFERWSFFTCYLNNLNVTFEGYRIDVLNSQFILPCFIDDLILYKIFILITIISNVILFGYFIKVLFKKWNYTLLFMILVPILFQFRLNHDPILSFYGSQQLLITYILLSLIFLDKYFSNNKKIYIFLSVIFYNFLLYSYEIGIFFVIIYPILIIYYYHSKHHKLSNIIKHFLPYIISLLIFFLLLLIKYAGISYSGTYSGIQINLNFHAILSTFLIQASSAFPLSYYFSKHSFLFCHSIGCVFQNIKLLDIGAILILNLFFIRFIIDRRTKNFTSYLKLFILGIILLLLPAMPISLTKKYQNELTTYGWGIGYIPVYIEYFGVALLLGGIVIWAKNLKSSFLKSIIITIILIGINIIVLLNIQNNRIVIDKSNVDLKYRRVALENALKNNIFQNVTSESSILIIDQYSYDPYKYDSLLKSWSKEYPWKNKYLVYEYTNKKMNVFDNPEQFINDKAKDKYVLVVKSYDDQYHIENGYVQLGKVRKFISNSTDVSFIIDGWKIYQDRLKEYPKITNTDTINLKLEK